MKYTISVFILFMINIHLSDCLRCYYCFPCDGRNMRVLTCELDKNFCSYLTGIDPLGDVKVGRRCESTFDGQSGKCYSNSTAADYKNVSACICNVDLCNVDTSYFTSTTTATATTTTTATATTTSTATATTTATAPIHQSNPGLAQPSTLSFLPTSFKPLATEPQGMPLSNAPNGMTPAPGGLTTQRGLTNLPSTWNPAVTRFGGNNGLGSPNQPPSINQPQTISQFLISTNFQAVSTQLPVSTRTFNSPTSGNRNISKGTNQSSVEWLALIVGILIASMSNFPNVAI